MNTAPTTKSPVRKMLETKIADRERALEGLRDPALRQATIRELGFYRTALVKAILSGR